MRWWQPAWSWCRWMPPPPETLAGQALTGTATSESLRNPFQQERAAMWQTSFARWPPCSDARLVNAGMRRASAARLLREESVTSTAAEPPGDFGGRLGTIARVGLWSKSAQN